VATTNGWVASGASWEEIERVFLKVSQVPLGRIGRVEEVAHAVVFHELPLNISAARSAIIVVGAFVLPLVIWEETQIRAWAESYDRNVLVAVRLINHLLPSMRQSGWGRIVNVSSVAGVMPQPTGPDYGALSFCGGGSYRTVRSG
jgi:NAD(P)-dependent dehydrogenase (short-subunit alcohol dehydrogenase family)